MLQVITFAIEPRTLKDFRSGYETVKTEGLPYIVAVDPSVPGEVLGYASASQFRGSLEAYKHTVEISLFCHPEHQGKGLGTQLLRTLLQALRDPVSNAECFPPGAAEPRVVKQVLVVMAVDETGKGQGLKLKEFYEREGFTLVSSFLVVHLAHRIHPADKKKNGHLKQVGFKFGRWYVSTCAF